MRVFAYADSEWLVAAMFRTGSLSMQMSLELAPENHNPFAEGTEEYAMYNEGMAEWHLHENAIERWEATLRFARESGIETHWTRRALIELNKHLPDKYPLTE